MSPHLGLGLLGIGRPWPTPERVIPTVDEVKDLLDTAVTSGQGGFALPLPGNLVRGLL